MPDEATIEAHVNDDVDFDRHSHHHTLGLGPAQAAAGNAGFYPGDLKMSAAANVTPGWLVCDGSVVSRSKYAALFQAIGTSYNTGGEAGTDFRLPDLRDRAPVGKSGTKALGTSGGAATVVIGTANLPPHTHDMTHTHGGTKNNSAGTSQATWAAGANDAGNVNISEANSPIPNSTKVNTGNGGFANTALGIQNPYQAVNYWIKT